MTATVKNPIIVQFKNNQYSAEQLVRQSNTGPMIEVKGDELHDYFFSMASSAGLPAEMMNRAPIFAKYDGKYVVLLGTATAIEGYRAVREGKAEVLKGRLISNPMLKRCIA